MRRVAPTAAFDRRCAPTGSRGLAFGRLLAEELPDGGSPQLFSADPAWGRDGAGVRAVSAAEPVFAGRECQSAAPEPDFDVGTLSEEHQGCYLCVCFRGGGIQQIRDVHAACVYLADSLGCRWEEVDGIALFLDLSFCGTGSLRWHLLYPRRSYVLGGMALRRLCCGDFDWAVCMHGAGFSLLFHLGDLPKVVGEGARFQGARAGDR